MSTVPQDRPSRLRMPFGFFAGPIAWGVQLFITYALTPGVCTTGSNVSVGLLGLITALVALAAGVLSLTLWQHVDGPGRHPDVIDLDTPEGRSRDFIASAGFLLSALFLLLIVVTALYGMVAMPCPYITQRL